MLASFPEGIFQSTITCAHPPRDERSEEPLGMAFEAPGTSFAAIFDQGSIRRPPTSVVK